LTHADFGANGASSARLMEVRRSLYILMVGMTDFDLQLTGYIMSISMEIEQNLSKKACKALFNQLSINGSCLDPYSESCFRVLMDHFDKGLNGLLDPSFYLSSIPAGYGKTEAIVSFVKAWKDAGFNPKGGILIALQSKDQISSLVKRLGLPKFEVGILTKDDAINDLGCGSNRINEDPVLITTQQMVASRTSDKFFLRAKEFYFDGKPRKLRIWDESFLISQPVTIKVGNIHALATQFGVRYAYFAEKLSAFANELKPEKAGSYFLVDKEIGRIAGAKVKADRENRERGLPHLPYPLARTLEAIRDAGGQSLLLASYGGKHSGLTLVGGGKPMPNDLAPAVVLDASGNVRGTYGLMEKAKRNLFRLPSPQGEAQPIPLAFPARRLPQPRTSCVADGLR
jgi:hypothetical protein